MTITFNFVVSATSTYHSAPADNIFFYAFSPLTCFALETPLACDVSVYKYNVPEGMHYVLFVWWIVNAVYYVKVLGVSKFLKTCCASGSGKVLELDL